MCSGCRFDKINYKTTELNESNFAKVPLRSSATSSFENVDKNCFLWSILTSLHICKNGHPKRISSYGLFLMD